MDDQAIGRRRRWTSMRFVRLVALFLGVGLIVAVSAAYVARNLELARDRDLRVATAAEVAAIDLRSMIDRVDTVADLATDPNRAVAALEGAGIAACATSAGTPAAVCGDGSGVALASEALGADATAMLDVVVVESSVVALATGPEVIVAGAMPLDTVRRPSSLTMTDPVVIDVRTIDVASDVIGVRTEDGRRLSTQPITSAPSWAVVASVSASVELESAERLAMIILLVLAVLLLGLAGFTFVAEHRILRERATIDPLTKLPNRSEFETRGRAIVQNSLRSGEGVCLMLVDLDGFKEINDTHGHHAGDEVLKVVGKRLRAAVRGYDVVARWGGDEFVLVLPGIDNEVFARSRATSLSGLVGEPMRMSDAGVGLRVGASVGIALLGDHGETLDELVAAADAAMYTAKRQGETFRIADPARRPGATAAASDAEFAGQPS